MTARTNSIEAFEQAAADLVALQQAHPLLCIRKMRPMADRLVESAKSDPANREAYLQRFQRMMQEDSDVPFDCLPYIMHRLRWRELFEWADEYLEREPLGMLHAIMEDVIDAYYDRWHALRLWDK